MAKEEKKQKLLQEEMLAATNTKATGSGQNDVHSKNFKSGAYSTLMILLMIVIVLVVNLAVTTFDMQADVSNHIWMIRRRVSHSTAATPSTTILSTTGRN